MSLDSWKTSEWLPSDGPQIKTEDRTCPVCGEEYFITFQMSYGRYFAVGNEDCPGCVRKTRKAR